MPTDDDPASEAPLYEYRREKRHIGTDFAKSSSLGPLPLSHLKDKPYLFPRQRAPCTLQSERLCFPRNPVINDDLVIMTSHVDSCLSRIHPSCLGQFPTRLGDSDFTGHSSSLALTWSLSSLHHWNWRSKQQLVLFGLLNDRLPWLSGGLFVYLFVLVANNISPEHENPSTHHLVVSSAKQRKKPGVCEMFRQAGLHVQLNSLI